MIRPKIWNFDLDIKRKTYMTNITPKQGDIQSNVFRINLFQGAEAYDLTGLSVKAYFKRPDEAVSFIDGVVTGASEGKVEITLTNQILNLVGDVQCELLISGTDGEALSTVSFSFKVLSSLDYTEIESANEFNALVTALGEVQDIDNRFNSVNAQLADIGKYLTPSGGSTLAENDSAAINNALLTSSKVILQEGTYYISPLAPVSIPANKHLVFETGAVLKIIPIDSGNHVGIAIENDNVILDNPAVDGQRTLMGDSVGFGHGIYINNAKNCVINNPKSNNCFEDGIYITGLNEDITINNPICNNNRRQGITVVSAKNLVIKNPVCTNTNGLSPEAGIDIEPNNNTDILDNILIDNPVTENNNGSGVVVNVNKLKGVNKIINIKVLNGKDDGSYAGVTIQNIMDNTHKLTGAIRFDDYMSVNAKTTGIQLLNYGALNTPKISLIRPKVIDCNTTNQAAVYGSAYTIYRDLATTDKMGNITIESPETIDTRAVPLTKRTFYISDVVLSDFENIKINNSEAKGINNSLYAVKGVDFNHKSVNEISADVQNYGDFNVIKNINQAQTVTVIMRADLKISSINYQLINLGLQLNISLPNAIVLGLTTVAGTAIKTTTKGGHITLEKIDTTTYRVVEIYGTWVPV